MGPFAATAANGSRQGRHRRTTMRARGAGVPARALPARHLRGRGIISDTFETAITWDRFRRSTLRDARPPSGGARDLRRRAGDVPFTHVYPDGPAPYFTMLAPARRGPELEQWDAIKAAASTR
jgi:alkyldihydroxyacetonephosphate synthase